MNIDTRPLFPPMHQQPIYDTGQQLPVAEGLAARGLSLPSSASLEDHEVDRVCEAIKNIYRRMRTDASV